MNYLKKSSVFLLLCFSLSSCEDNQSEAAKKICDCAKPLLQLNQQIQSLASQGKQEEMQALFPQAAELQKQVIDCGKKATEGNTDKVALKKALEKNCDLPSRLIEAVVDGI